MFHVEQVIRIRNCTLCSTLERDNECVIICAKNRNTYKYFYISNYGSLNVAYFSSQ